MILRRDPKFRALKVGGYGLMGSASYWLTADHLLIVSTGSYTESYRRFYFTDMQAVICQQNRKTKAWSIGVGAFAGVNVILSLAFYFQTREGLVFLGFGLPFLLSAILLLVNVLRGPSCAAHITSAVQTVPLPYVQRWRKAQKLVNELSARVSAVQTGSRPAPEQTAAEPAHPETPNG